jgi:hypothetical protein
MVHRVAQPRPITDVGRGGGWLDDLDGHRLVAVTDHEEGRLVGRHREAEQVATGQGPQGRGESSGKDGESGAGLISPLGIPGQQAVIFEGPQHPIGDRSVHSHVPRDLGHGERFYRFGHKFQDPQPAVEGLRCWPCDLRGSTRNDRCQQATTPLQ